MDTNQHIIELQPLLTDNNVTDNQNILSSTPNEMEEIQLNNTMPNLTTQTNNTIYTPDHTNIILELIDEINEIINEELETRRNEINEELETRRNEEKNRRKEAICGFYLMILTILVVIILIFFTN